MKAPPSPSREDAEETHLSNLSVIRPSPPFETTAPKSLNAIEPGIAKSVTLSTSMMFTLRSSTPSQSQFALLQVFSSFSEMPGDNLCQRRDAPLGLTERRQRRFVMEESLEIEKSDEETGLGYVSPPTSM